ncbi:hypothetical protein PCI56_03155 [Plesiomonas shigelloides subsp. oncorhynchi]|nr:hypothetical protein [Plesiomonas shigelloides]
MAFMDKQRLKISRGLNFLEQAAANQQFCNLPQLNLADIAIVCLLDYLLFREVDVHWPKRCRICMRCFYASAIVPAS